MSNKCKKKKKSCAKLFIFLFLVLAISFYFGNMLFTSSSLDSTLAVSSNSYYSGIGQKNISGKDGYFTTFTTTNGKTYKEYKQGGNSSWSERYYWGGTMAENGCGITCLATLASRLWYELYPRRFAKKICIK
ncbi:MAG: hypothetical protein HFJ27_05665 [Clostridia bacterium]|nr:hypothetical protein [Clostridia bacterium]